MLQVLLTMPNALYKVSNSSNNLLKSCNTSTNLSEKFSRFSLALMQGIFLLDHGHECSVQRQIRLQYDIYAVWCLIFSAWPICIDKILEIYVDHIVLMRFMATADWIESWPPVITD